RMMPTSVTNFNAKSSVVDVDGTDGFAVGDLVLMVGSSGCTLGKITQVMRRGNPIRHASKPGLRTRMAAVLFRRSAIAGRIFTRLHALRSRAGL
ncbi:MAG: hypothetical protein Q8K85_15145, partial [Hyphomicrobium sp.]|nr:hypothetical protein [Hyphomicrobium sp.]